MKVAAILTYPTPATPSSVRGQVCGQREHCKYNLDSDKSFSDSKDGTGHLQ